MLNLRLFANWKNFARLISITVFVEEKLTIMVQSSPREGYNCCSGNNYDDGGFDFLI